MTTPCGSIGCKVESAGDPARGLAGPGGRRHAPIPWRGVSSLSLLWLVAVWALLVSGPFAAVGNAAVSARVLYRDGSPCAYCWLTVQLDDREFKVRADAQGFFEVQVDQPEQVRRIRSGKLRGEPIKEGDALFLLLHQDNPQLEPIIRDLRKHIQTYQAFTNGELLQQFVLEGCYLIVEREESFSGRISRFRSVQVDLAEVELLEDCSDPEQSCIRLQPARVVGQSHRLDGSGAAVVFSSQHRESVGAVLNAIALLARACGNLDTRIAPGPAFPESAAVDSGR